MTELGACCFTCAGLHADDFITHMCVLLLSCDLGFSYASPFYRYDWNPFDNSFPLKVMELILLCVPVVVVAPVPVIPVIPVVTIVPIVKGWTSAIISTVRAPAVRTTPITTVLAITTSLIRPRRGCLWWRLYSVVDLSFDLWDLDTAESVGRAYK